MVGGKKKEMTQPFIQGDPDQPTNNAHFIKLPPELRRRNFIANAPTEHADRRPNVEKKKKTCTQRVHVPTELPLLPATVAGRVSTPTDAQAHRPLPSCARSTAGPPRDRTRPAGASPGACRPAPATGGRPGDRSRRPGRRADDEGCSSLQVSKIVGRFPTNVDSVNFAVELVVVH